VKEEEKFRLTCSSGERKGESSDEEPWRFTSVRRSLVFVFSCIAKAKMRKGKEKKA